MDDKFTFRDENTSSEMRICDIWSQQLVSGEVSDVQAIRNSENLSVQEKIGQETKTDGGQIDG